MSLGRNKRALIALVCVMFGATLAANATLGPDSLNPDAVVSSALVQVDDTIYLSIVAPTTTTGEGITSYQFDLTYVPAAVTFVGAVTDGTLPAAVSPDPWATPTLNDVSGTIHVAAAGAYPLDGTGTVASVDSATTPGEVVVTMTHATGFSGDGDLVYIDFVVDPAADAGTLAFGLGSGPYTLDSVVLASANDPTTQAHDPEPTLTTVEVEPLLFTITADDLVPDPTDVVTFTVTINDTEGTITDQGIKDVSLTVTFEDPAMAYVADSATLVPDVTPGGSWTPVVTPTSGQVVFLISSSADVLTGTGASTLLTFQLAAGIRGDVLHGNDPAVTMTVLEVKDNITGSYVSKTPPALAAALEQKDLGYGDVSGDGTVGGTDASDVLQYVVLLRSKFDVETGADGATTYGSVTTPTKPWWSDRVLSNAEAIDIADVTNNAAISAFDASKMLQFGVGLITDFDAGVGPGAPTATPEMFEPRLIASSDVLRPGQEMTLKLAVDGKSDVYAGEVVVEYDPAMLRVVSVTSPAGDAIEALSARKLEDGKIAIAVASVTSMDAGRLLEVTFEPADGAAKRAIGEVRVSKLGVNESKLAALSQRFTYQAYEFRLLPNYPNPFNPETWIPFELDQSSKVTINIYDVGGKLVRKLDLGHREQGMYVDKATSAHWDGRNALGEVVASGVYRYGIRTDSASAIRRMVIRK
ncbi:hypothetical protein FJZ36_12485 [Candidatus Poribacteria bacterium]|nr:hypothetical protein [Candidatus Poribacteria bacterium]